MERLECLAESSSYARCLLYVQESKEGVVSLYFGPAGRLIKVDAEVKWHSDKTVSLKSRLGGILVNDLQTGVEVVENGNWDKVYDPDVYELIENGDGSLMVLMRGREKN